MNCPDCNSAMRLLTARRGRNAGNQFWGCLRYPVCRGKRSADEGNVVGSRPYHSFRPQFRRQWEMRWSSFAIILAAVLFAVVALEFGPVLVGCGIKGNISVRSGERIYHMPGQKYYFSTRINLLRGEKW